jgi:hypothetical protein
VKINIGASQQQIDGAESQQADEPIQTSDLAGVEFPHQLNDHSNRGANLLNKRISFKLRTLFHSQAKTRNNGSFPFIFLFPLFCQQQSFPTTHKTRQGTYDYKF